MEDFEGGAEIEGGIYFRGRVDLDAVEGELFFFGRQEFGCGGVVGEVDEGDYTAEDGEGSFDCEEVFPGGEGSGFDLEDSVGEKTAKGVGDVGGCVEDCETAGEFASTVELSLVIDDQWTRKRERGLSVLLDGIVLSLKLFSKPPGKIIFKTHKKALSAIPKNHLKANNPPQLCTAVTNNVIEPKHNIIQGKTRLGP